VEIAVIGLGRIGLPLATQCSSKGHRVYGCDANPDVVAMVQRGEAYPDEAGLSEQVRTAVAAGRLSAQTSTTEAVQQADVIVIIVPLVVDHQNRPDYHSIDGATSAVAAGLRPGALVVYETTLPVGDTRGRFGAALSRGSGLRAGLDFSLAFSPERVSVGHVLEDLRRYPKVVGGIDERSTVRAAAFYRAVLDAEILPVGNVEIAEFAKLAETTYRDVNIALANELACYAETVGVDASEAFAVANTQPFSHLHRPGVGVGGHCIPVYPYFYANRAQHQELAQLSRRINDGMAEHAVQRLAEALGGLEGCSIAVLGYAYREDVKGDAFTVAQRLIALLRERGARPLLHDPLYEPAELERLGFEPFNLDNPEPVSAIVLQAAHSAYQGLQLDRIPRLRVVFDGRNALDPATVPEHVCYLGVGRDRSQHIANLIR
jgi:nucleotide sugar dehydrogenase